MLEVTQGRQCLDDNVVAGNACQGCNEGHATRIVFVATVVKPLGPRECVQGGIPPVVVDTNLRDGAGGYQAEKRGTTLAHAES